MAPNGATLDASSQQNHIEEALPSKEQCQVQGAELKLRKVQITPEGKVQQYDLRVLKAPWQ